MVDASVVNRLLQMLQSHREQLKKRHTSISSFKKFKADEFSQKAIQHYLQEMIQACIDIGNHIVSYEQLGNPEEYREIFDILYRKKIISEALTEKMKKMVGFRNVVIHLYEKVDLETIYNAFHRRLSDFDEFTMEIRRYLKSGAHSKKKR